MFSAEINALTGVSTRNPRRRQRTGSDDSIALRHNPKRLRRSVLSADTFKPLPTKTVNGYVNHADATTTLSGHAIETKSQRDLSVETASLAIRHKGTKKIERRTGKTDGSIELVSYTISTCSFVKDTDSRLHRPKMTTMLSLSFQLLPNGCATTRVQVCALRIRYGNLC